MQIQDLVSVGGKTTMRIGGQARYYAELKTREDVEQVYAFAKEKGVPMIALGGGSNTVFADGVVEALVVRLKADVLTINGNMLRVEAGKILASLLNDLATKDLDLSALTGIPGTVGGAIFGNAGQGPTGIWIDTYVKHVTVFLDGSWRTLTKEECDFRYRESLFKDADVPPLIWEVEMEVPRKPGAEVKAEIERLLKKRFETQPHVKTAGSCFKALPDGTPAWKLIDAAGLRGHTEGGVQIAEKHSNFLLNVGGATYADVLAMARTIRKKVPRIAGIEMRLYGPDGKLASL